MTTLTGPAPTIERDRFGRPMIAPKPGAKKVAYTRATTLSGALDDLNGLMLWKQRMTLVGAMKRRDIQVAAAAADPGDKATLNKLASEAADAGGATEAATIGTALHELTERIDRDLPLGPVPAEFAPDIEAYRRLASETGWKVLDAELFTVCHALKVAGTADRILKIDGQVFVADIKTSQSLDFSNKFAAQIALYANSLPYDLDAGATKPWDYPPPSTKWGVIIHMPSGQGSATLHAIDIEAGWEAVRLAVQVRSWRARRDLLTAWPPTNDEVILAIRKARSIPALERLWATHADTWTDEHTRAAAERKAVLS